MIRVLWIWLMLTLTSIPVGALLAQPDITPPDLLPLTVLRKETRVELSWPAPSDLQVEGYRVYRAGAQRPIHNEQLLVETSFSDIGLSSVHNYAYEVRALLVDGREWRGYRIATAAASNAAQVSVPAQPIEDVTTETEQTGIRLILPEVGNHVHAWGVTRADDPEQVVQWLDWGAADARVINLRPGKYNLRIQPAPNYSKPVNWPASFEVKSGQLTDAEVGGVHLTLPDGGNDVYAWGVTRADDPEQVVQWVYWQAADARVMHLPPGKYRLRIQPAPYYSKPVTWLESFEVKSGQLTDVRADGVRLTLPEAGNDVYAWGVTRADDPEQVVQWVYWQAADARVMHLPPGKYRLRIQPAPYYSKPVIWPESFEVKSGRLTDVRADGVRLTLPEAGNEVHAWGVTRADDPEQVVQWLTWDAADLRVVHLPPGVYRLQLWPHSSSSKIVTWPNSFEVIRDELVNLTIQSGIRLHVESPDESISAWRVTAAEDPETVVQYLRYGAARTHITLVPPGTYRVDVRAQDSWRTMADNVNVRDDEWAVVEVPARQ